MEWDRKKIYEMINKRISFYSSNKISNLKEIVKDDKQIKKIINFSCNSPRDSINIMKSIFDRHISISDNDNSLPILNTITDGLNSFCKFKFEEIIPIHSQRKNIKKIKSSTFTIPHLYNEIYRCKDSTARNMLMPWTRAGYVITSSKKLRIKGSPNPINLYTFKDIRIAREVCSDLQLDKYINTNLVQCDECETVNVFDKNNVYEVKNWHCHLCQSSLEL